MYKSFSYYYDKMMDDIDYDFFVEIVKDNIPLSYSILDAGCGTGKITIPLKKMGYNICGVDNSSEMLMVFEEKLREQALSIPLYENSIEDELAIGAFNAVISFLDVINYVDYKKAFKTIYDSLTTNGIFIFDVYQVSYAQSLNNYFEDENGDDYSYHWDIAVDNDLNITHNLMITDRNNHTYKEVHHQKTFSKEEYLSYLEFLGFSVEVLDYSDDIKLFVKATK